MGTDAPRPVPPYRREQVATAWWYCLYCCQSQPSRQAIETHVRIHVQDREVSINEGEDYTSGAHLKVMIERWESWSLAAADRFARALDSLGGVDDFAFEVGMGLPDA